MAITTPQKAYSSLGGSSDEEQLLLNFFEPPESFWQQMEAEVGKDNAPKMYRLSLSLTMDDFLHDLTLLRSTVFRNSRYLRFYGSK